MKESFHIFDRYYRRYDEWYTRNRVILENEGRCIASLIPKNTLILDVGVGTGVFAKYIEGEIIGIDPASNPLRIAWKRGVQPVKALGEFTPFRSRIFDVALMTVTLCFLENPGKVLEEVKRVLKPRGYHINCIIPRDSPWGRHYIEKAREGKSPFYRYAHFYTVEELSRLLEEHGFKPVEKLGTLSSTPWEPPRLEPPSKELRGRSFICVKAIA